MNHKQLEKAAIAAHARGERWSAFWRKWGPHVIAAEPINRDRYRRLCDRLLALLVSGDCDGQHPAGDTLPWLADDQAAPHDTRTAARIDWQAAGVAVGSSSGTPPTNGLVLPKPSIQTKLVQK